MKLENISDTHFPEASNHLPILSTPSSTFLIYSTVSGSIRLFNMKTIGARLNPCNFSVVLESKAFDFACWYNDNIVFNDFDN